MANIKELEKRLQAMLATMFDKGRIVAGATSWGAGPGTIATQRVPHKNVSVQLMLPPIKETGAGCSITVEVNGENEEEALDYFARIGQALTMASPEYLGAPAQEPVRMPDWLQAGVPFNEMLARLEQLGRHGKTLEEIGEILEAFGQQNEPELYGHQRNVGNYAQELEAAANTTKEYLAGELEGEALLVPIEELVKYYQPMREGIVQQLLDWMAANGYANECLAMEKEDMDASNIMGMDMHGPMPAVLRFIRHWFDKATGTSMRSAQMYKLEQHALKKLKALPVPWLEQNELRNDVVQMAVGPGEFTKHLRMLLTILLNRLEVEDVEPQSSDTAT